jgi:hypothetical protein
MKLGQDMSSFIAAIEAMVAELNDMAEPTTENAVISKSLWSLPMDYEPVIPTSDSIPKAMKTFQNLIVRLLREETLTKCFVEQDNGDGVSYFSNSEKGSFNKLNMEAKKKVEQIGLQAW